MSTLFCISYRRISINRFFRIMQHLEFIFFDINQTQTGIKFMNFHNMLMTHFSGLYVRRKTFMLLHHFWEKVFLIRFSWIFIWFIMIIIQKEFIRQISPQNLLNYSQYSLFIGRKYNYILPSIKIMIMFCLNVVSTFVCSECIFTVSNKCGIKY